MMIQSPSHCRSTFREVIRELLMQSQSLHGNCTISLMTSALLLQQIKGDQQCLWGLAYLRKDMGCVDPSQIPSPGVWNSTKSVSRCTETSRSLSRWAQLGTPGELCRTLSLKALQHTLPTEPAVKGSISTQVTLPGSFRVAFPLCFWQVTHKPTLEKHWLPCMALSSARRQFAALRTCSWASRMRASWNPSCPSGWRKQSKWEVENWNPLNTGLHFKQNPM